MSPKHLLQLASFWLLSSAAVGQLDAYTCDRPSKSNVGNLLDKVVSLEYCLDQDPVPSSIFTPSPLNVLPRVVANGFKPVIYHLEQGMYIGSDGFYINTFFVYPRDECKSKKPPASCTTSPNGAILIDAPASFGTGYGAMLKKFLASIHTTLQAMIITHEHWDHEGAIHSVVLANPTLDYLIIGEEVADTLRKYETLTFENKRVDQIFRSNPLFSKNLKFNLEVQEDTQITYTRGNQTFRIMSGFGHTPGNLVIWHAATSSLINIDSLVFPKYAPFFAFAVATDIPSVFKLFDYYRQFPFKYFINGHFTHIGTPADVALGEQFAIDILDAAYRAQTTALANSTSLANFGNILQNTVGAFSGHNNGNVLLGFREFLNQVAWNCVDIVLDPSLVYSKTKWVKKLAGVRATLYSHCRLITENLRIQLPGIS